jgi:hypothetical protein
MLIWKNHRTEIASHDLFPILEIVLDDWKRLWDVGKGRYQLWDEKTAPISVDDVAQGYTLGNCYLIASLAAIAERPELIKHLFNTNNGQLNEQGIYEL